MNISVILIDKSEIVKKMLSHCLHYFSAKVLRIENWDENKEKIKEIKPDILFVEWEIKKDGKALAFSVAEEMNSTPVVVLYRSSSGPEINALSSDQLPHRLMKPFDPKILRDQFSKLVPQMKESKIHPFLKFPKAKPYEKEMSLKENAITPLSSQQTKPKPSIQQPPTQQTKPKPSIQQPPTQQTKPTPSIQQPPTQQTKPKPSIEQSLTQQTKPQPSIEQPPIQQTVQEKQIEQTDSSMPSINSMLKETNLQKASSSLEQQKDQPFTSPQKETFQQTQTTDSVQQKPSIETLKSNIEETKEFNIDETTQNDLAPMAIKSSISEDESALKNENIQLNEKDILRVLNKYKDTIEFQQIIEKTLSEHAVEAVAKILQNENLDDVLEKSLNEFKKSQSFKALVELETKKYLQKQLPLTIKAIIEEEIQKIIGD